MNKILKISAVLFSMVSVLQANVTMNLVSFQEQTKTVENGETVKEWVKAEKIVPGTVIRYVNSLHNSGTKKATKLVITNPISENMEYVANSASCENSCSISYSIDDGKSFKTPENLYVGTQDERRLAEVSDYTNIKWVVNTLAGESESFVEYKAQLK